MAKVTVKCFGVLRMDSKIDKAEVSAGNVAEVFAAVNELIKEDMTLSFGQSLVYINGERCTSKKGKLSDGDEVWLLSPASGG